MTEQQKNEAIKYIEGQLENGYIDLGTHDQYELEIIEEAIKTWKAIDKFNSIGCTSFLMSQKDIQKALIQPKVIDYDYGGCTVEWIIKNSKLPCSGCVYENAHISTDDFEHCVGCMRKNKDAKNDYYKKE